MTTGRVTSLLFLFFAVIAAATLSSGAAWATPGTCETLPGGVIELESTGGAVGPTGYATLGAALADVNNGTYTGTITIDVCGDTTEGASAVLNASGTGGSSYTGVTIAPAGGAPRTIAGSIAGVLIDLNGAGSVVIDGLNTGGDALTVDNTSTAAAAATIRFIADASGNTVRNCTIKGSTTGTASGTIVFGTTVATGNLNDTITANTITSSGANLPVNAIYSAGGPTFANTGIAITNNNIQDYFSATVASNGILVASNSAGWIITGNKLFQTATRTATTAATHRAINIVTSGGGAYTVSNNTVGYASAAGAGTTTYIGAVASLYRAIEMTVAASPASEIQGNTVTAISFSTTSNSSAVPGVFAGISVLGGSVNVGTTTGNTIGSATTTGAITVTSTVTGSLTEGIYIAAPAATVNVQNNNVGGITASSGTAAVGFIVRGIETAGALANVTLTGNVVGSTTTANSIQVGINPTTTAVTTFVGILNTATGTVSITNNTVQNDSVLGSGASIFQGISNSGTATGTTLTITGNSVISGTNRVSAAATSNGIITTAVAATVNVNNNVVRGMSWLGTNGAFRGIEVGGNSTSAININDNMLGDATASLMTYSVSNAGILQGILSAGGANTAALSIQRNDVRISNVTATTNEHDCINLASGGVLTQTVKDNTFTNIDVNTTGTVYLVRVQAAVAASGTQTVTTNSIVGTFNKASISGTFHAFNSTSGSPATATSTQSNNNFSNVTVAGTSSAFCMNSQEAAPRTIQNNVCNNWVGGSGGAMTGIRLAGFTGAAPATVSSNTITNFSSAGGLTGIQVEGTQGVSGAVPSPLAIVTSNTINSLSTTNGSATGIIVLTPSTLGNSSNSTVTSNTISGLSATLGASGLSLGSGVGASGTLDVSASLNVVSGLSSSGGSSVGITANGIVRTANVFRNKVYDIELTGATGSVTGLSAGSGTSNFYNNLAGDLRAPSATTTGNPNIVGLNVPGTAGTANCSYNTVYFAGTSSGSPFSTAGVLAAGSGVLKLRNNIVANATIPTAGGRAVAVWRTAVPLWNYDTSSNNNDLYAATAYYDGVSTATTLSDMWALVYPRESASFSENPNPLFVSTVGSSPNFLHIVPASTTLLESHAVNIAGITDDYDTDIRQGNPGYGGTGTAPDVGADEFEGIAQGDVQPPAIVHALLGPGAPATSRPLTATIVDATGVEMIAGVRPRLYFKKSTDANDETGWKYVEAIGSGGSPFDFTIDYTMLNAGSVSVGDTIQYFVVAQDTVATPNIGIYQGSFAAPPTSVALTSSAFPIGGTINSYTIITAISGALTVCPSGCDYDSLTNAGGLFETMNGRVFTGNVTADLLGDSTAETGLNALNQWPEDPSGNFSLTIRPGGGAARTVSGNVAGGMIKLNGADRVTIDGLNTDGNSLTVSNTSTTNPSATIHLIPTGNLEAGASNNTIRNLNIVGGANTLNVVGIAISGAGIVSVGTDQDGNTISGNTITKAYYAIYVRGGFTPLLAAMDNTVISNNTLGPASQGADSLGLAGIYMYGQNNPTVSGNTIRSLTAASGSSGGIYLVQEVAGGSITNNTITNLTSAISASGTGSITGIYLGSLVSNMTVSKNTIQSVSNTLGTGAGARGIVSNSEAAGILIANNMISDVFCFAGTNSSGTNWPVGIHVELSQTGTLRVYNNSVNLYGSHPGVNGVSGSAAMLVGGGVSSIDIRDNVFANTYDNSTVTTERTFSIHAGNVLAPSFFDINYNDYYVVGPNPATTFIGALGGTNIATLAAWKTATGKDAQSLSADPLFVSPTDLHINTSGGASPVENTGSSLAVVTDDIDGDLRHPTTPDIGADEARCHAVVPGESCNDANPCTVDSCAAATGCSNVAGNAGDVCRSVAGSCDVAETCDGASAACPADMLVPVATLCRAAAGDCDAAELCTGDNAACPADVVQPSTTECRAAVAGGCDVAESCDGATIACPADIVQPAATLCRASAGDCDVAESCDGASAACPTDTVQPAATECRAPAGTCDVAESCDGASTACPTDSVQPAATECRAPAGACDVAEACDGATVACPNDAVAPAATECRAAAGGCDLAEACDGASVACPFDAVAPLATECRAAAGGCDLAEACDGASTACPTDVIKDAGVECRAVAGNCDFAESCDGATTACPSDVVATAGVECRASAGICDLAEACDGTNGACPANAFEPDTTVCRESTATCDPAEFCSGKDSTCPANAVNASAPVGNSVRLSHNKQTAVSTITWTEAEPGPFNVSRGARLDSAPWAYNHGCYDQGLLAQSTTNTTTPVAGQMLYFLVSRDDTNCPESTLGPDSAGSDRPNVAACPNPGADVDLDGVIDALDDCPMVYDPSQSDVDMDGVGDVCDNCATTPNQNQSDVDNDSVGDACDTDMDGDGLINGVDNCPRRANPDQLDADGNGFGDACE